MTGARDAIEDLLHRYVDLHTRGDHQGTTDLFATDGVLSHEPYGDMPTGETRRGRAEILGFFDRGGSGSGPSGLSLVMSNIVIDADDATGTATARSDFAMLLSGDGGVDEVMVTGRYHDRLRVEDGAWRFAVRHYETLHMSEAFARMRTQ